MKISGKSLQQEIYRIPKQYVRLYLYPPLCHTFFFSVAHQPGFHQLIGKIIKGYVIYFLNSLHHLPCNTLSLIKSAAYPASNSCNRICISSCSYHIFRTFLQISFCQTDKRNSSRYALLYRKSGSDNICNKIYNLILRMFFHILLAEFQSGADRGGSNLIS